MWSRQELHSSKAADAHLNLQHPRFLLLSLHSASQVIPMSQHLGHKHTQIKLCAWQLRVGNKDTRKSELEAETVSGRKGLRKKMKGSTGEGWEEKIKLVQL